MCNTRATLKGWKDSASIILAAKTFSENKLNANSNYEILTVKRSVQSKFMPNTYVFPGGKMNKADNSYNWLKLYKHYGFTRDSFKSPIPKVDHCSVFSENESSSIPKDIALRITAIRETFEESGILICRKHKQNSSEAVTTPWAVSLSTNEILKWQEKVMEDPLQFYQLCTKFELYPDIWCLYEWSNWATPVTEKTRFDTIFFLAIFEQIPSTSIDNKEIQRLQWTTPSESIAQYRSGTIILPPPQFYEISRLQNFSDINHLSQFAKSRAKFSTEKYLPYRIITDKVFFHILPGDGLYPKLSTLEKEQLTHLTLDHETEIQHRMELTSIYNMKIKIQNFTPANHIAPFINSKL